MPECVGIGGASAESAQLIPHRPRLRFERDDGSIPSAAGRAQRANAVGEVGDADDQAAFRVGLHGAISR